MTRFDDKLAATIAHARRHTLGDLVRRTASRAPDRIALIYRDLRQSYAELDATINRTANALAQRGVVKGERIALLSHNNHAFVVTCLALARLGVIASNESYGSRVESALDALAEYIEQHLDVDGLLALAR